MQSFKNNKKKKEKGKKEKKRKEKKNEMKIKEWIEKEKKKKIQTAEAVSGHRLAGVQRDHNGDHACSQV